MRRVIRWGDELVVDRAAECQWVGLVDMTQVKVARARRRSFRLRLLVLGSGRPNVGDLISVFAYHLLPTLREKRYQKTAKNVLEKKNKIKEPTAR